jgi:pyruvate,water dikinase
MWIGKDGVNTFNYYIKEFVKFIGKDSNPDALLKEKELSYKKSVETQKVLIKELKITEPWLTLFNEFGNFMITKIYRRYAQIYAIYKMQPILKEIASRLNITVMQMHFMLTSEVRKALLNDKINKKELEERTKFCVYLVEGKNEVIYTGKKAEDFAKSVEQKELKGITQIKGQTGCVGKAIGVVKCIFRPSDMSKMNQGDILVSIATDPDIVSAMKKAGAIVTEQGGVTSHAAIVARELNIPCVIGTKIATQVLKDGDLVEVDAYTGIVKKLEKTKKETQKIETTKINTQWKEVASDFNSPLMRNHIWTKSWKIQAKIFDLPFVDAGVKCEKHAIKYIADMDSWRHAHEVLRTRIESNPKFVESLILNTNKLGEEINAWSEDVFVKKNTQEYTSEQLCTLLDEFNEKQALLYAYGILLPVLDFQEFSYVEGTLNKILREKIPEEYAEAYKMFTAPTYNSFQQDQEEDLLHLMEEYYSEQWKNDILSLNEKEIQKKHPQFWENLVQHTKKHAWVYYVYQGPAFTEKEFLEFICQYLKKDKTPIKLLEAIHKNKKEIEKKKEKYLTKINLTDFERDMLLLAGIVVWGKPRRKDYQSKTYYHAEYLYKEIAKRVQCSLQEAQYAHPELLKKALITQIPIDKKYCKESYEFHIVIPNNTGDVDVLIGTQAKQFYETIEKEKKIEEKSSEVKGSCACSGYVKGKVKIINSPQDMHKMQEGDILISVATTPSIVPAMKKAAAIITNEGGITCHASIVSRELNIPCIVGTKHATTIFQDNDFVEVNATKGIVKKIKEPKSETNNPKPISKYIAWFNEINNKDVSIVGGKGASLGEMYNTMPVPNGFCITVEAYKETLSLVLNEINVLLSKRNIESLSELEAIEEKIKLKIENVEIPNEIKNAIKENYNLLRGKVAVRSSATTEDLPDASFAGQQDTYLNIEGEDAVLEAVKKCWASLFNARAINYREEKGFNHTDAYLAVVIQKMIDAEKAGVLFTVNPITNEKNEMIIESCFGLGEKLVSGEITPDTFIINKEEETIKEQHINCEEKTLTNTELKTIIQLGKAIEKHYGKPMDIEWAIPKTQILQARPITTLKPDNEEVWVNNFSIENCGSQLLHPALHSAFSRSLKIFFGEQKYMTEFIAVMDGINLQGAYVKEKEIEALVDAAITKTIQEPERIKQIHKETYDYNDEYMTLGKEYCKIDFSRKNDKEIAEAYKKLIEAQIKGHSHSLITTWFIDSYKQKFSQWLMEKTKQIIKNSKKDAAEVFNVLTTSSKNSLQLQEEIESLIIVKKIKENNEQEIVLQWNNTFEMPPITLKSEMEAHYQKWRWIPFAYLGPAYEREYYLEVWKGLIKENFDVKNRIKEIHERPTIIRKQKEQLITELTIDKETQQMFDIAADIAFLKGYRKETMYHGMYALSHILEEAAKRLHISFANMYLLTDEEIYNSLVYAKPIDISAIYERKNKYCFVYNYITNTVQEYRGKQTEEFLKTKKFFEEEIIQTNILKGTTACNGYAKGIVKIINTPLQMEKMKQEDILVAHTTMPNLLPAMKKAAAIITEDGGITCHAAIVSRELKIPCITGIKNATKVLKDGMTIEVNANEGIIRIINE